MRRQQVFWLRSFKKIKLLNCSLLQVKIAGKIEEFALQEEYNLFFPIII